MAKPITAKQAGRKRWKGVSKAKRREFALRLVEARRQKREREIEAAVAEERMRFAKLGGQE